jgi:hypothetical protein
LSVVGPEALPEIELFVFVFVWVIGEYVAGFDFRYVVFSYLLELVAGVKVVYC